MTRLKSDPTVVSKPTNELLAAMKSLAVIAVATGVTRAELMSLKQDRDEQFRAFAAMVRGKAETCGYTTQCACTCTNIVDFTDSIARDVLLSGIADTDIRREMLGTQGILDKPVNNINEKPGDAGAIFAQVSSMRSKDLALGHSVFTKGQWRRSRFMDHPTVQLELYKLPSDYKHFKRKCPNVSSTTITALADCGAQACLWTLQEFIKAGFSREDLILIPIDLVAANKSPILIEGSIPIRLRWTDAEGTIHSCATIAYVSKHAKGFYLSLHGP